MFASKSAPAPVIPPALTPIRIPPPRNNNNNNNNNSNVNVFNETKFNENLNGGRRQKNRKSRKNRKNRKASKKNRS
jgi:hypothetical protein